MNHDAGQCFLGPGMGPRQIQGLGLPSLYGRPRTHLRFLFGLLPARCEQDGFGGLQHLSRDFRPTAPFGPRLAQLYRGLRPLPLRDTVEMRRRLFGLPMACRCSWLPGAPRGTAVFPHFAGFLGRPPSCSQGDGHRAPRSITA